jgi:hypothetical protein
MLFDLRFGMGMGILDFKFDDTEDGYAGTGLSVSHHHRLGCNGISEAGSN